MAYKTLMLQLYKPSHKKREILRDAMVRYSKALQFLLDRYRGELTALSQSGRAVSRAMILRMIEKEVLRQLNEWDIQPFKDSLKIEFAAIAMNYIAHLRKKPGTRYPRVYGGETEQPQPAKDSLHPLYFGRYDTGRDYCLLIDRGTGRFYAKLYLLNCKNKINAGVGQSRLQLQYIYGNAQEYLRQTEAKRFLIFPLAFGKHQLRDLNRILENPALAHTARLKMLGGEYYLLVNVACEAVKQISPSTAMGISRAAGGGLHYTVCGSDGGILEAGPIPQETPEIQKLYLFARRIIRICKKYTPQVVVEANGGRNDKLLLRQGEGAPISAYEYTRLVKILGYKLAELGLPEPVALSANRLFSTCPACMRANRKSRISQELFICVECGYASGSDAAGSLILVRRLHYYQHNRVPIELTRAPGSLIFTNQILGFECVLPPDVENYEQLYYDLNRFIHLPVKGKIDSRKYSVLKKLKAASDLAQAVRLCESGKPVDMDALAAASRPSGRIR